MKITLEMYDSKYTYESDRNDYNAEEVKDIFSRMLVQAGYTPNVIEPAEGGRFKCEYVEEE